MILPCPFSTLSSGDRTLTSFTGRPWLSRSYGVMSNRSVRNRRTSMVSDGTRTTNLSTSVSTCRQVRRDGTSESVFGGPSVCISVRNQIIHDGTSPCSLGPIGHKVITGWYPHGLSSSLTGVQTEGSIHSSMSNGGSSPDCPLRTA